MSQIRGQMMIRKKDDDKKCDNQFDLNVKKFSRLFFSLLKLHFASFECQNDILIQ